MTFYLTFYFFYFVETNLVKDKRELMVTPSIKFLEKCSQKLCTQIKTFNDRSFKRNKI